MLITFGESREGVNAEPYLQKTSVAQRGGSYSI